MKQWAKSIDGKIFSLFAISKNALIAIDNSFYWWVVGYIKHPENVDLSKWGGGNYRAKMSDGIHVELTSKDVVSSGGNILELKNSFVVKK